MNNLEKIKVSIVGGSGYAGGELLRLLLDHPNIEIIQITSRKYKGFPVTIVNPNLRSFTNLKFTHPDNLKECDLLFLCLPNTTSQRDINKYMGLANRIIDLGADFRLNSIEDYRYWYGEHVNPDLLDKFVYGIAELNREEIRNSNYVACGGCEATCSILTLYPLVKENLIEENITIDTKMGSSAAGSKHSKSSHHPERAGVVRSFKPTMHRHTAEVEQELGKFGKVNINISATAIEMVRGILVTCQVLLNEGISELDVWKSYKKVYKNESFIRIVNDKIGNYRFPEPKVVTGTNYCDIGLQKDIRSNRLVVIGAIDNLVKGTAGQAVQAMNIMYEINEATGLEFSGLHPV